MAKASHLNIGTIGEDIAVRFLSGKGFLVLDRNWRSSIGEIDIVASEDNDTLVFVEVKTMRRSSWQADSTTGLVPEDNFSTAKLIKFNKASEMFVAKHSRIADVHTDRRQDLITIALPPGSVPTGEILTEYYNNCLINHYRNVF